MKTSSGITKESVTVFFSNKLSDAYLNFFTNFMLPQLSFNRIKFRFLQETNDIWCRDFMPIQVGINQFVQFSLTKDYYYKKDRHKVTNPAPICKELGIDPIIPTYKGKPIYLDGGNVIRGFSKAIITEKVFADNDIPRQDLTGILLDVLQVNQIIFIPVETGDDTGHADGMVRFLDKHTVLANDYSGVDVANSFRDQFYETLADSGFDIQLVPYHPENIKVNGYWSAAGCYINFLQVGEKIFLPTFDDPKNDDMAIKRFGEIFGFSNVIPIPSEEIALGGGVLNCLSWEITE
jgi:agmatine deiminase